MPSKTCLGRSPQSAGQKMMRLTRKTGFSPTLNLMTGIILNQTTYQSIKLSKILLEISDTFQDKCFMSFLIFHIFFKFETFVII